MKERVIYLITFFSISLFLATYGQENRFRIPHAKGLEWELKRRILKGDILTITGPANTLDKKIIGDTAMDFPMYPLNHNDEIRAYFIQINGKDIGCLVNVFNKDNELVFIEYRGIIPQYLGGNYKRILRWSKHAKDVSAWYKILEPGRIDGDRLYLKTYNSKEKLWQN